MRISDWISDVSSDLDLLGHGKARVAQMLREDARGADLLHPEFGVLVEVLVERVERRIVFVEQCGQPRLSGGKIGCRLRAGRGEGEGQRSRRPEPVLRHHTLTLMRSEARRGGKEGVSPCIYGCSPYHK